MACVFYCVVSRGVDSSIRRRWIGELPYLRQLELRRREESAALASLIGVQLLKHALDGLGRPVSLAQLRFPRGGKPQAPDGIEFSIAHSAAVVACALSTSAAVGIDIERVRRVVPRSLRHVLSAGELDWAGSDAERLLGCWTAREAVVKADGHGGIAALRRVQIDGEQAELAGRRWHLSRLQLVPGYVACLASSLPLPAVRAERVGLDALLAAPRPCG